MTLVNCSLSANTAVTGGGGLFTNASTAAVALCNSILWGNLVGVAGTLDDDLTLLEGSPAVDAGSNAHLPPGVVLDLAGLPRLVDDPCATDTGVGPAPVVDMGACEFPGGGCATTDAALQPFLVGLPAPNPTRGEIALALHLPDARRVTAGVVDVEGRRVSVLVDGVMPPGRHRVGWDGRDAGGRRVPSGLYFLRVEAGDRLETRKVLVVR